MVNDFRIPVIPRHKVITLLIVSLLSPLLAVTSSSMFLSPAEAVRTAAPIRNDAKSVTSCTGKYKLAFEYSKNKSTNRDAQLAWKRGTQTALSDIANSILEWKRGTPTVTSMLNGAQLSLKKFLVANPSANIDPNLLIIDDHFDTATAVAAANDLVDDGCVLALIGPSSSHIASYVIPIYSAAGIPMLSVSAIDPSLKNTASGTFHRMVLTEDPTDLRSILAVNRLGVSKPAVIENDYYEPNSLSKWANAPNLLPYSLIEWKRGTPTVTALPVITQSLISKGADGFLYNSSEYEGELTDQYFAAEYKVGCPSCGKPLIYSENSEALFDLNLSSGAYEGVTFLANAMPMKYANSALATEFFTTYGTKPLRYATESYDAASFLLAGILAGNTTRSNLNTYINTHSFNGLSGKVAFSSDGERLNAALNQFKVASGQLTMLASSPLSGYTADGAIENYSPASVTSTSISLLVKEYTDSATTAYVDLLSGSLNRRVTTSANGSATLSLINGTNYITVTSRDRNEIGIRSARYEVVVNAGAITSVKNSTTNASITASGGVYIFKLSPPTLIGKVSSPGNFKGDYMYLSHFTSNDVKNGSQDTWIEGRLNESNTVFATVVPTYRYGFNLWVGNPESWQYYGDSSAEISVSSITSYPATVIVAARESQISGQVSGTFGEGSKAYLEYSDGSYWRSYNTRAISSDGHFGFASYDEGIYRVRAVAVVNGIPTAAAYSNSFTISKANPTRTSISLAFPTANVTGLITLDGIAQTATKFAVLARAGSFSRIILTGVTDSSGNYSIGLPSDTYSIVVSQPYTRDFATTSISCIAIVGQSRVCNVALTPPSLVGTVSGINGLSSGRAYIYQEYSPGRWYMSKFGYGTPLASDNKYSFLATAGTYRLAFQLVINQKQMWIAGPKCVVTEGVKTTCNATYPSEKFIFNIKNIDGSAFQGPISLKFDLITINENLAGNQTSLKISANETITAPLVSGDYLLTLNPGIDSITGGVSRKFTLTSTNGVISNVKPSDTNTAISAVGGIYSLVLGKPQIAGKVVLEDGVTPAANVRIFYGTPTVNERTGPVTDAQGRFVVDPGELISDQTLSIWGLGLYNLKAGAGISTGTGVETVTILNGVGSTNVLLRVKPSNLVGTITGDLGPSKQNLIFLSKVVNGGIQWLGKGARTDANGNFGFYLPPGTYQVQAQQDAKVGGLAGWSSNCVVTGDSPTVCNIALPAPNFSGSISILGKESWNWGMRMIRIDNGSGSDSNCTTNSNCGLATSWTSSNNFAGITDPGTYRIELLLGVSNNAGYFMQMQTFGTDCVVPATGSVTCNISLPAPNLKFKVASSSGEALTSGYYAQLQVATPKAGYVGQFNTNSQYLAKSKCGISCALEESLLDGSYRLTVRSVSNSNTDGIPQSYLFDVSGGAILNMRVEGTTSQIAPTDGIFNLRLRSPALSGRVVSPDGASGIAFVRVDATLGRQVFNAYTDANGYFGFNLGVGSIDGDYVLQARVNEMDNLRADSSETVTTVSSGAGPLNLIIRLRSPNVTGTVSGPLGISVSNWVNIRKLNQNGGWDYIPNGYRSTTNEGKFGFYLEPGKYQIQASSDLEKAGGTSNVSAVCTVVLGQNTVCNVSLLAPNVTGILSIAGAVAQGSIEMYKKVSKSEGDYRYVTGTSTNGSGYFGVNLAPGTYRMRTYIWSLGDSMIGPECVVPETGTVSCNLNLPVANLKIKVASAAGVVQTQGPYIYAMLLNPDGTTTGWNIYSNATSRIENSGLVTLNLVDAQYLITIHPGKNQKLGRPQQYRVIIESGTVTSLRQVGFSSEIAPVSGIYTLALGSPPIAGTVVAPDGTTPVPNSLVSAFSGERVCQYCEYSNAYSDQSGYFGFEILPDGQYQVVARPPYADSSKADSAPQTITVSGGLGSGTLVVPLRTPNVTGVVRGPKGVSVGNYIEVRKLLDESICSGCWEGKTFVRPVYTDAQGNFAFYLEPGRYRFTAREDMKSAGGIGTISDICIVPSSGTIACNITLPSANFKFKIVDSSNSPLQNAYGYIYYADKSSGSIKNTNPQIAFTSGGTGEVFLEDGTWSLQLEPAYNDPLYSRTNATVAISGGVVTSVRNSAGDLVTSSDGYFNLQLPGINLKGLITFSGETYTASSLVYVKRLEGNTFQYLEGRWVYNGMFGFKVPAGTYQIEVRPYSNADNGPVMTRMSTCIVSASGTTTCDVALLTSNLKGKITNELGDTYRYSYATIWKLVNGEVQKDSYQGIDISDGQFRLRLEDGTYRIRVEPYWEYRAIYTGREYEITVISESVTSVKDIWANEVITANAGTYLFKLGTPSARGKVLEPGSSSVGIANVNVLVGPFGQLDKWIYSTSTDASGNFALTIPDGTYTIRAVPTGQGFQYGKSETQTIVVTGGAVSGQITLRLRSPNLTGRIVTPGASPAPLANVNVNIWIAGEYFYSWTDSDGRFGIYVDNPSPDCPSKCTMDLNYYKSSDYTYKRYVIDGLGAIGNKAIGGVTTRVTVLLPQSGSATTPNRYSYVSVESVDTATSYTTWVSGGSTDELGKVGLNLEDGLRYKLTFYPNWESIGQFSPKIVEIASFSAASSETMTVTFDRPNLKLSVASNSGVANSYGWYQVSKLNSGSGNYEFYSNNYLDYQGKGATLLVDGTYKIHFWPGKTSGVETEISVVVTAGTASGSQVSAGLATVVLPTGNISGYVSNQANVPLKEVVVTAVRSDDNSKISSTVTDIHGYYELNLDRTYAWTIKALEPNSAAFGSLSLATASPSNAALTNRDITISVP
ncbi:Leucine-binding protein domain containing protein [Candidatus Nanopelagicaceae bacterium]